MSNSALQVARTGLDAQSERMRIIANNLANVNTTGFKRDRAEFATLAYQTVTAAGRPLVRRQPICHRAQPRHRRQDDRHRPRHHPGRAQHDRATRSTSRSRATAISRSCARTARTGYTRAGNFHLSSEGQDRHLGRPAAPARNPDPGRRPVGHDRHRRHRLGHRSPAAPTPPRSARSRFPASSIPPACRRWATISTGETAASGSAADRRGRHRGPRHDQPGLARRLQRQRRRGAGRHDRDPARL